MLPRQRPQTFYDLLIEVAPVRPGSKQGGAVHPYLDRRHPWRGERTAQGDGGMEAKRLLKNTSGGSWTA